SVVVDQIVLQQRVQERAAAVEQQILTPPLFELCDCLGNLACEDRGVPFRVRQGSRGHILRQRVHPRGELALFMFQVRPGSREPFVVIRPSRRASLANKSSLWSFASSSFQ